MTTARDTLDAALTEAQFQRSVTDLADALQLPWAHVRDSRGSHCEGLPDLIIVDAPHATVLALELKTQRGRMRAEQKRWLDAMARCSRFHAGVYRPADWPALEGLLVRGERT